MDNQISQMLLANRQVAYLITDTQLEVINAGGDYGLLHNLITPPCMTQRKHKRSTEHSHAAYLQRPIVELLPELEAYRFVLQEMLYGGAIDTQVLRINRTLPFTELTKAQTVSPSAHSTHTNFFDIVLSPKHDARGQIDGFLFLIEDTTEACLMWLNTQQLQDGKQMLQDQLDMIAHELGAPLTVIAGYIELLREVATGRIENEHLQYLNLISSKVDHLHVILKNLFNMAYVESDNLRLVIQPVNIVNLVHNAVAEIQLKAGERQQQVHIKTDGEQQIIHCDRLHIGQALMHLLDNACKFSPLGSAINVTVSSNSRPGFIHIAITDSGAGIPPDERDSIFQRFYRTKFADRAAHSGVGLGLYTARRMVEIHNGEIWCDNAPHAGAVFHVMLPFGKNPTGSSGKMGQPCGANYAQIVA
ncbi:MAG: HAMP domain-containing sensor histidine kinase [Caldilineaceae bacterium]